MKWDEFRTLLVGIAPETPLGRIVAIRAEENKEVLKHFTRDQRRIRSEWRRRRAQQVSVDERDKILEALKQAFTAMTGGGRH